MTRKEWIESKSKILIEEEHMTEEQVMCYLNKICDMCDKENADYDEVIFRNWLKLGAFAMKHHTESEVREIFTNNKD